MLTSIIIIVNYLHCTRNIAFYFLLVLASIIVRRGSRTAATSKSEHGARLKVSEIENFKSNFFLVHGVSTKMKRKYVF